MALEISYWKMEGKSDVEIRRVRIKKVSEATEEGVIVSRPVDTDVITLERSDNQSPYFKVLWQRPNYVHIDER